MTLTTSAGSTGIFDEPTASLFQASRTEIMIDRPARDVWSVLTDQSFPTLKLWNPTLVSVRHISGEPGQENELVLMTKDETARQAPSYMRTIRIVPNQQRVLRIDTIDGNNAVFVDHSLYELNGKTRLVYNVYIETRRVPADQVKAFDFKRAAEVMMDYLNQTHELLKKAVEELPTTSALK